MQLFKIVRNDERWEDIWQLCPDISFKDIVASLEVDEYVTIEVVNFQAGEIEDDEDDAC